MITLLHARADYNDLQKLDEKIPSGEPVFLLRAQDEIAWKVVQYYAFLRRQTYSDKLGDSYDELLEVVSEQAEKMKAWGVKKQADL